MSWVFWALAGYVLNALAVLGDKVILGSLLPGAVSYAFWQGMLSLGVFALAPFGFGLILPREILLAILAGSFWLWGLFSFFAALSKKEATRVVPLVLALTPLFLFFLEGAFLAARFTSLDITAAGLLIAGSILLSRERAEKAEASSGQGTGDSTKFLGFELLAAFLFAASLFLMKSLFLRESFINVLIWSRLGLFGGALLLLFVPFWREEIRRSFAAVRKLKGGIAVVGVKLLGAFGALSIFFALSRGPAALVQSLQGIQYGMIFLFALLLAKIFPQLLKESFEPAALVQKLGGVLLVSLGVFFLIFFHA